MSRTARTRQSNAIQAARTTSSELAYRGLSGAIAALVEAGELIRTGDLLDTLGADLPDGQRAWYGRHVAKAFRNAHDGAEPVKVWVRHRTTRRWTRVFVYAPTDPALYIALQTYKATRHLGAVTPLAPATPEAA